MVWKVWQKTAALILEGPLVTCHSREGGECSSHLLFFYPFSLAELCAEDTSLADFRALIFVLQSTFRFNSTFFHTFPVDFPGEPGLPSLRISCCFSSILLAPESLYSVSGGNVSLSCDFSLFYTLLPFLFLQGLSPLPPSLCWPMNVISVWYIPE